MNSIIEALRSIIGNADFYNESSGYAGSWDYGAMIEYFVASLVLLIVISSIFKLLRSLLK